MKNRTFFSKIAAVVVLLFATLSPSSCGWLANSNDSDDKPSSAPTGIPAGWDGLSDWRGSQWTIE